MGHVSIYEKNMPECIGNHLMFFLSVSQEPKLPLKTQYGSLRTKTGLSIILKSGNIANELVRLKFSKFIKKIKTLAQLPEYCYILIRVIQYTVL